MLWRLFFELADPSLRVIVRAQVVFLYERSVMPAGSAPLVCLRISCMVRGRLRDLTQKDHASVVSLCERSRYDWPDCRPEESKILRLSRHVRVV